MFDSLRIRIKPTKETWLQNGAVAGWCDFESHRFVLYLAYGIYTMISCQLGTNQAISILNYLAPELQRPVPIKINSHLQKTQLKNRIPFSLFFSAFAKIKSKIPCDFMVFLSRFFKARTGKTEYHSCSNKKSHPWTEYTCNPLQLFWPPSDNKDSISESHQSSLWPANTAVLFQCATTISK
jgi:hypothetical protein